MMKNDDEDVSYKYKLVLQGTPEEYMFFSVPSKEEIEKAILKIFRKHPLSKDSIKFWSIEIDATYFEIPPVGEESDTPINYETGKLALVHDWDYSKKKARKFDMRTRTYVNDIFHYFDFKVMKIDSGEVIRIDEKPIAIKEEKKVPVAKMKISKPKRKFSKDKKIVKAKRRTIIRKTKIKKNTKKSVKRIA